MSDGYQRFIRGLHAIIGVTAGVAIGEPWIVGVTILAFCGRALYDIWQEERGGSR